MTTPAEWCFMEDRSLDYGHGWRDHPHTFRAVDQLDPDSPIYVFLVEEGTETNLWTPPDVSYAYICPTAYRDQRGAVEDNIRTCRVLDTFPGFQGADDMESHFAFRMSPARMRAHLQGLGMVERELPYPPPPTERRPRGWPRMASAASMTPERIAWMRERVLVEEAHNPGQGWVEWLASALDRLQELVQTNANLARVVKDTDLSSYPEVRAVLRLYQGAENWGSWRCLACGGFYPSGIITGCPTCVEPTYPEDGESTEAEPEAEPWAEPEGEP